LNALISQPWLKLRGRMDMVVLLTPTTRRGELIQLGWRAGIGAALIIGGYLALLLIPVVLAADFERSVKAAFTGLLGVTPLLTKLAAVALLGKPAFKLIKKVVARLRGGGEPQRPRRH
jgi:hypothetical protein